MELEHEDDDQEGKVVCHNVLMAESPSMREPPMAASMEGRASLSL